MWNSTTQNWCYLLTPVPALALGLVIAAELGGGPGRLGFMVGCAAVGTALVVAAGHRPKPGPEATGLTPLVALAVIGSTLIQTGRDGVRRWVALGPFELNASLLLTPLVLVACLRLIRAGRVGPGLGMLAALQIVHIAQPDAAAATGVAAAVAVAMLGHDNAPAAPVRMMAPISAACLAAAAWLRPDPLPGTAGVEGVLQTAFDTDVALGVATLAAICALPLPFLLRADGVRTPRTDAAALGAYIAALLVAAQIGEFPVLVVGYGASTIWGWYAAAAAAR